MASTYETLANIQTNIRNIVQKDTNTLTDAVLLPIANKWYRNILRELSGLNEQLFAQISSTSLVAGQREYPMPADDITGVTSHPYGGGAIQLTRVEVALDGANWYVAKQIPSLNSIRDLTFSGGPNSVDSFYQTNEPAFAQFDDSIMILPSPTVNVTNGLYIWYIQRPAEMTATSDIPDMKADWLNVLEQGMLVDVYTLLGRIPESDRALNKYQLFTNQMKNLENKWNPTVLNPASKVIDYI
jgi:hypothetical protein